MRNYSQIFILIIFIGLFSWGCSKETVEPNLTGTIEGKVQNNDGQGISSVSISTNPGTDAILTSPDGQFTIRDVPTGNYSIQAEKDSFITKSTRVSVKEDRVTNAQIVLVKDDEEGGSSNGNLKAKVTFTDNITYNSSTGTADSNFVDVEYMVENISSSNRVGNYEVYFKIFTPGSNFNQEISGDSLATNEQTFGSFTKYIREFEADSVQISGIYTPDL